MRISLTWDKNFPKGYGHTSIAFLKRCCGFYQAKNGDLISALNVVSKCVKQERLQELRKKYPNAVLIPVLGRNQLPLALAYEIGLPIWLNVYLLHSVSRKLLCAIHRLLHKPIFTGYIRKNTDYILVDDIIAQGGTILALRNFVTARGGNVVAVIALAYAVGSQNIAPLKKNMIRLFLKFGNRLVQLLNIYGIAVSFYELTNSQVIYLNRFTSFENIIKKIAEINNEPYPIIPHFLVYDIFKYNFEVKYEDWHLR